MTLGNDNGTDGQTDRQTDRQSATQYAAPPREEGRIKKRSERRKHCALAVQNFRPAADSLPGGAGRPKFNQLYMVTTCSFELSW